MRKLLFISVMMLLACHVLSAEEAVVTARIEQSHRDDYGAGYIFPMKERGMLFQSLCKKSDHGQRFFRTEYYDTNLNLVFVDSVLVDKNMEVDNQLYEKNVNYYLCVSRFVADTINSEQSVIGKIKKNKIKLLYNTIDCDKFKP